MDIDETKQVKLKDKPMMTLLEAAEFTGIGRHKLCELSDMVYAFSREMYRVITHGKM